MLKKFQDFINALNEKLNSSPVTDKDWDRMLKLHLKGDEGKGVAATIKDKTKAIARFVAGNKLNGTKELKYEYHSWSYSADFREFGDRAIELGATPEEIQKVFDETEIPAKYVTQKQELGTKQLGSFAGDISRMIIDLGLDITFIKTNGWALTSDGKSAMERNGRKWTIGYKSEINLGSKKVKFAFDAITDEGGGSSSYVVYNNSSDTDKIFGSLFYKGPLGTRAFVSELREILVKNKK